MTDEILKNINRSIAALSSKLPQVIDPTNEKHLDLGITISYLKALRVAVEGLRKIGCRLDRYPCRLVTCETCDAVQEIASILGVERKE